MAIGLNVVNCNTGSLTVFTDGCAVRPEEFVKSHFVHPSLKLDLTTTTLDNASVSLLIKKGLLIPLEVALQIDQVDSKANIETQKNKIKTKISDGLLEFTMKFKGNDCLEKALRNLQSRNFGIAFTDAEGKTYFDSKNNLLQGFELSMIDVDTVKISDSSSNTTTFMVTVQFTRQGTAGFNERRVFIAEETFDFYKLNGVEAVKLSNVTTTAANYTVKVVAGCDGSTPKLGLATANFRLQDASGLTVVATVSEIGGGVYKLTGAGVVAGAKTLQLYDTVNNVPVADILNTQFMQSNVATVVLT